MHDISIMEFGETLSNGPENACNRFVRGLSRRTHQCTIPLNMDQKCECPHTILYAQGGET